MNPKGSLIYFKNQKLKEKVKPIKKKQFKVVLEQIRQRSISKHEEMYQSNKKSRFQTSSILLAMNPPAKYQNH